MGRCIELFNISVEHLYFSDGLCRELSFVPTESASQLIEKTGMIVKKTGNGIHVFCEETKTEALKLYLLDDKNGYDFTYKVFSNDKKFENYTALPAGTEDSILFFSNSNLSKKKGQQVLLHQRDFASEKNLEKINSPILNGVLQRKDRFFKPLFIVNITFPSKMAFVLDEPSKLKVGQYRLRFDARKTIWKYFLLGMPARKNLHISDLTDGVQFGFAGQEVLPGNKTAYTFKSKTPIPLREVPDKRFQLIEMTKSRHKTLIKRLPVASAHTLSREIVTGEEITLSEIYINL